MMTDVGRRLRNERDRLGLSQVQLGELGGVKRNTQSAYESGGSPLNLEYLSAISTAGVDVGFLITGTHAGERLDRDQTSLLASFAALDEVQRSALMTVTQTMAGHHALSQAAKAHPSIIDQLPSEPVLEAAFQALLRASREMNESELARELATRLPTLLRVAEGAFVVPSSGVAAAQSGLPQAAADDRRERRRA